MSHSDVCLSREALEQLFACALGAEDLDSVRPQAAHEMMADRTGSHVLEVSPLAVSQYPVGPSQREASSKL